jgi:electron transfer flavoprotein alpha subunit
MTTWIISTSPHIQALIDQARALSGEVVLIDAGCGPRAGVDRILTFASEDIPAEALAPAMARAVEAQAGDVVLVRDGPAERVLAGAVAAALDAPVLTDVRELSPDSATVGRFGGITLEQVRTERVRVVIAEGGAAGGASDLGPTVPAVEHQDMIITETLVEEAATVDLASAERIVSVGMGFRTQDNLALAQRLAEAINAGLACSRPIAEGQGWMPRESYIGVTGLRVSPGLYVALGISGQLQHMAGVREAKTIVAVNSDSAAPVFASCDYGVIGDIYDVLPVLTAQIEGR